MKKIGVLMVGMIGLGMPALAGATEDCPAAKKGAKKVVKKGKAKGHKGEPLHHEGKKDCPHGKIEGRPLPKGAAYLGAVRPVVKESLTVAQVLKNPRSYSGKRLTLRGVARRKCRHGGCWADLSPAKATKPIIRILTQHKFVLPDNVIGREVVAVGRFMIRTIPVSRVQQVENMRAKQAGRKPRKITRPLKLYLLPSDGVKILPLQAKKKKKG